MKEEKIEIIEGEDLGESIKVIESETESELSNNKGDEEE